MPTRRDAHDTGAVRTRTPDILRAVAELPARPYLVGFAAESGDVEERAARKLAAKGCDLIVANVIGGAGDAMGAGDNEVVVIGHDGPVARIKRAPKPAVATQIWDAVAVARGGAGG